LVGEVERGSGPVQLAGVEAAELRGEVQGGDGLSGRGHHGGLLPRLDWLPPRVDDGPSHVGGRTAVESVVLIV